MLDGVGRVVELLESSGLGSPVGLALLVLVAAVLVALGVRALTGIRRSPAPGEPEVGTVGRHARDWLQDAATAEAGGQLREAVRCHYRALVAELAADGLVEEVPGRTAGEYRAEVAGRAPGAVAAFGRATDRFEVAWYAERLISRDDLEEMIDAAAATRRAVGESNRATPSAPAAAAGR